MMDTTATNSRGGMGTWVIILILFLFFSNGNGFGGFGGGAAPFMAGFAGHGGNRDVELLMNNNTSWQQQMGTIQNNNCQTAQIMQGLNNINNTVMQGFMGLQPNFCEINRNIDRSIYEAQKNTCDIISNQNCNTQKILDLLNNNTITQLRTDLQSAQLTLSNSVQTQTILNAIQASAA